LREERRRHAHERQVMQELQSTSESSPNWDNVSPLLDEAISTLKDQERDALLLRYFKNQDFRAVGAALGVSDDTARKCVARSLDKLRAALQRRGVTTTATALSASLASHAVQAAPAGLAGTWISTSLASEAIKGGATFTFLKLMSMTKFQLGLGVIVVGSLAATVAIQHQTESKVRGENQVLRQQLAGLATDNESLSNRLQQVRPAKPLTDDQLRELLRLRGEVGTLRQKTNLLGTLREEIRHLQAGKGTVKNQPEEEAKFLAGTDYNVNAAKIIAQAVWKFMHDNNNAYPTNFGQLDLTNLGHFPLDTLELVNAGKVTDPSAWTIMLREQATRQSPQGLWQRVYLMSDGSAQVAIPPDGNFEAWEQNWEQNHAGPTAANSQ